MAGDRVQRRIAAILAADVVGYSRLMGEDEEATLATLKTYRDVTDRLIAHHAGRIFGSAGDSVIAEFSSPVDAVRCCLFRPSEGSDAIASLAAGCFAKMPCRNSFKRNCG